MSYKRLVTVALGVAAILAFVAPMARASNMGFKLERPLDSVAPESKAIYYMSFPFYRSFQDLGQHDPADATKVQTPDGCITAADVLIDWFTNGDGFCPGDAGDNGNNFPDECGGASRTASLQIGTMIVDPAANPSQTLLNLSILPKPFGGGFLFSGTDFAVGDPTTDNPGANCATTATNFPTVQNRTDETDRGYQVEVPSGLFPAVIVGSHNPDITNWVIPWYDPVATGGRNENYYSLPYHTTFTDAEDFLSTIWDATEAMEQITLVTFDPDPTTNPAQLPQNKSILPAPFGGGYIFSPAAGTGNFALVPGNGYIIKVDAGGPDSMVTVPHSHF